MNKLLSLFGILALLITVGAGCQNLGARTEDSGFQKKSVSGVVSSQTDSSVVQVIPYADNTIDFGTSSYRWRTVNGVIGNFTDLYTNAAYVSTTFASGNLGGGQIPVANSVGALLGYSDFTYTSSSKLFVLGGSATTSIYGNGSTSTFGGAIKAGNFSANQIAYANSNGTFVGNSNFVWNNNRLELSRSGIGTTVTSALYIANPTAAASGTQQYSPSVIWQGNGFKTDATSSSQPVDFRAYVSTAQGTSAPTGNYLIDMRINEGSWTNLFSLSTGGRLTILEQLASANGFVQTGSNAPFGLSTYGVRALGSDKPAALFSEQTDVAARQAVVLGAHYALTNASSTLVDIYNSTSKKASFGVDNTWWTMGGYRASDYTRGASSTVVVKGSDGNNCNIIFKDGLFTTSTCP